MTTQTIEQQLTDLLREAGPAHHKAYIHTNGEDPEWPLWYAQHLRDGVERLLGTKLTVSDLVYWLVRVERERQTDAAHADWPAYYARFFLEHVR
jgi:hypothetical protein